MLQPFKTDHKSNVDRKEWGAISVSTNNKKSLSITQYNAPTLTKIPKHTQQKEDLEKLFNAHKNKLYHFVRSKCSNPSDIDDLVQETYLQAIRSIKNFSGKSSFSTWLLGIAINLIHNHYNRAPQYKYTMLDSESLHQLESNELTPDKHYEQEELVNTLQKQVEKLPKLDREILTLFTTKDASYKKIAQQYSMSISSIKSRLYRTRAKLVNSI